MCIKIFYYDIDKVNLRILFKLEYFEVIVIILIIVSLGCLFFGL